MCNLCIPCKNRVFIVKFISKEEFKPTRKKWPFKTIEVGSGIELSEGFNDCNVAKIASAARTYAAKSDVIFEVATIQIQDEHGCVFVKAVQILRTK